MQSGSALCSYLADIQEPATPIAHKILGRGPCQRGVGVRGGSTTNTTICLVWPPGWEEIVGGWHGTSQCEK